MGNLALKGGSRVRNEAFPGWPVFDDREEKAVLEVLRSGKWWYGEKVARFEKEFAAFQDAGHAVSCANGTAALEISLQSLGIGAGDEVIVPPYTFVATALAVFRANAVPVFADILLETANIDPGDVEKKITGKTRAVIPVHFAGQPCDMDALGAVARRHNLRIIEDACHSWGSRWKGKGTGAIGDCGAFSFQMSKNITAGEGGIILTDEEDIAEQARSYANCGRKKGKPWYEHYLFGGNYRMTEFQAAILSAQLTRLAGQTEKREENGAYLDGKLKNIPGIRIMEGDSRATRRSYHLYIFRYLAEEFKGLPRERFIEALTAEGIPVSPGYPKPLYENPLFSKRGDGAGNCPLSCPFHGKEVDYAESRCLNAERICREAVWLSHPVLLAGKKDMDDIVRGVEKVRENLDELL